eukprot:2994714-Rhodomonas_salina.1
MAWVLGCRVLGSRVKGRCQVWVLGSEGLGSRVWAPGFTQGLEPRVDGLGFWRISNPNRLTPALPESRVVDSEFSCPTCFCRVGSRAARVDSALGFRVGYRVG